MRNKVIRLGRILVYTFSMYIVTHLIVFLYLFPVGTPLIYFKLGKPFIIKKRITGLLFKIIGQRLKVLGRENLEPGKTYLIVSNYPGSYAGFALMNVFPKACILVHSFLRRAPIVGFLLKSTGAVFVQQKKYGKTKQAIDDMLKHNDNHSILVLPEGGRSPDGRIRKFRNGFVYILRHSSMDLLPVTLRGFYRLKPMKRLYLDPDSDLEILIHEPIRNSSITHISDNALIRLTEDIIRSAYRP